MRKIKRNKTVIINKSLISSGTVLTLLAAVLITLKALGLTSLSWWAVTSPLWIGFALVVSILVFIIALVVAVGTVCAIGYGMYAAYKYLSRKIRNK